MTHEGELRREDPYPRTRRPGTRKAHSRAIRGEGRESAQSAVGIYFMTSTEISGGNGPSSYLSPPSSTVLYMARRSYNFRLPEDLVAEVDKRRGDVPRTKILERSLEAWVLQHAAENSKDITIDSSFPESAGQEVSFDVERTPGGETHAMRGASSGERGMPPGSSERRYSSPAQLARAKREGRA